MNLRKQQFKPFKINRLSNSSIKIDAGQVFVDSYGIFDVPETTVENLTNGDYSVVIEQTWSVERSPVQLLETTLNGFGRFYFWVYTPLTMQYIVGQSSIQSGNGPNRLQSIDSPNLQLFYYKIGNISITNGILSISIDDAASSPQRQWIEIPNLSRYISPGILD